MARILICDDDARDPPMWRLSRGNTTAGPPISIPFRNLRAHWNI